MKYSHRVRHKLNTIRSKLARVVLALALLFPSSLAGLVAPTQAHADADPSLGAPYVGQVYNGSAYITHTGDAGNDSFFSLSFSGNIARLGLTPAGAWHCLNPTAAAPSGVSGYATAKVLDFDENTGIAKLYVEVTPPGATDGITSNGAGLTGYQRVGGTGYAKFILQGDLDIVKVSANPAISNNNKCYSLEGAIYGIFSDRGCTRKVGEMITNAHGYAKSGKFNQAMYYVKELRAPRGYALDTKVYDAWVQSGETRRVNVHNVQDVPQNDPIFVLAQKKDSVTGKGIPQANGELEGAEFTVKYYDGFYNEHNLPAQATRTWIIRTDKDGFAQLRDSYKIAGGEFYLHNNVPTIPLGTISIQETKAPKGYLLPADNRPSVQQVTANGWLESVNTLNTRIQPETPIRGGIKIEKQDDTTGTTPQGNADFAGISFDIINKSKKPVVINGKTANTNEVALTLTTDNSGRAQTSPETLPFGDYEIRESKTNAGYLNTSKAQSFTISQNKQIITYDGKRAFTDAVARGTLDLEKQDTVTGNIPQGNASRAHKATDSHR